MPRHLAALVTALLACLGVFVDPSIAATPDLPAVATHVYDAAVYDEPGVTTTHAYTHYDQPAQFDKRTGTTRSQAGAADGELSALQPDLVAANALPALPKALSGGAADTYVYFGTRGGKNVYTGITNNLTRRGAQHGDRFDQLARLTDAPVTRGQARSIEQALIARNPGFENKINSISPTHSYYDDAVSWGESWLRQNGF